MLHTGEMQSFSGTKIGPTHLACAHRAERSVDISDSWSCDGTRARCEWWSSCHNYLRIAGRTDDHPYTGKWWIFSWVLVLDIHLIVYIYMYVYIGYAGTSLFKYIYIYMHINMYAHVNIYKYINLYVYMLYIYIFINVLHVLCKLLQTMRIYHHHTTSIND